MRRRQRDYRSEYDTYHGTDKQKKRRAGRNAARRKMVKSGAVRKGDGKDVDHKNRNPRQNKRSNLRVTSQTKNRGWRKGKTGK
jgi:hypothetical protein